ncbi:MULTISPECIES: hypothetical protein [Halomonadaceae]|uniref:Uncharacterized protein n=1 Tax=Vreelandella aquamarina TaxID=77097 RepID=A0A857GLA7_9GAMM|nr:hypothetical protein [Halomonas meridiana]QHD50063.1 hypothetical protein CTT34_10360 [Halomonas meridiana]
MLEIEQSYEDGMLLAKIIFGQRPEQVSVTVELPNDIDSREELRRLAIDKAKEKFKAILEGNVLPFDSELKAIWAEKG